jgi:hypothetical protein
MQRRLVEPPRAGSALGRVVAHRAGPIAVRRLEPVGARRCGDRAARLQRAWLKHSAPFRSHAASKVMPGGVSLAAEFQPASPTFVEDDVLGSCRLAGVDPREYLADVLPRLTGRIRLVDLPSLLPSRWAAQRAAATAAAAACAQA